MGLDHTGNLDDFVQVNEVDTDDNSSYERSKGYEAPRCPNCYRVMSNREASEQGCCNDCYDGTIPWQT